MEDKQLLAAVREDFAAVRMNTEAQAILADGRSLRRRRNRHRAYGAGVTVLAAVAAFGGVALASGASGTSGTGHARLTAWTVQKQTDGAVDVTIHDLLDVTGLQQELTADGVPAEVVSAAQLPASCVNYPAANQDLAAAVTLGHGVLDGYAFVIHPAAIPSGSKLLIDLTQNTGSAGSKKDGNLLGAGLGLVYASSTC